MRFLLRFALPVALPATLLAVYAPVPEQEQGKALTYRLGASAYHDSNIFGAATDERSSMVYSVDGGLSFQGSVTPQTFASFSYDLTDDHFVDRPSPKDLVSQALAGRVAHEMSPVTSIDLSAGYNITRNPQSLLNGIPLNVDQSFRQAEFDGRFTTQAMEKTNLVLKYRYVNFDYDLATLAADLNRDEHLAGLELATAVLPEVKLVGEYRYQAILYGSGGSLKDKDSNFLMAGTDYNPGKLTQVSARAGFEARHRRTDDNTTVPYVELSSRYAYAEGSFLSAGYVFTLQEPSDVTNYTDEKVNRLFANVQHRLSGAVTVSGSLTWEPSVLLGRGTHRDDHETTTRLGLGVAWQPDKNWTVTASYDLDDITSDAADREQHRERVGMSARLTF